MSGVAIKVENVSKSFKLPHERHSSIKSAFLNILKPKRTYEKQEALKDISFEIKEGEFFGIVGRNGSGKSTLLKLLAGIYASDSGHIQVNGRLTPFIELGVGFNPELTGRENVFLNGALLGFNRQHMSELYDEIVAFAEIEKFMDQKLKNYSSGMQVRLAFSIAIQAKSEILVLDEVLAVGDEAFQRKCFKIFDDYKKNGQTVVLVTHDMGTVKRYCDRGIMIQDGKILIEGTPREVALRYGLANTTEAGKSSSSSKLERPRDPAIKIAGIELLNADKPTSSFSIEDDITAEITLDVHASMEMQINLFLIQSDGTYLGGINSYNDLKSYTPGKGRHKLTCTVRAGQLSKGEYSVGVGVYTPGYIPEIIDIIDRGYSPNIPQLSIIDSSNYQDGQIYIQAAWSEFK